MNSTNVVISNLTFKNSPFWTLHPVYCSKVLVQNVTILAPSDSPNTDGIDPAIRFTGKYGEHPDSDYNPNALPTVERITIKHVSGENIKTAGVLEGIEGDDFHNICLANITLNVSSMHKWNCSHVQGFSDFVSPKTCHSLRERIFPQHISDCYQPPNFIAQMSSTWTDFIGMSIALPDESSKS
ncbi:putative polygalacturonase, partial [Cucurbita argyrosperma subsp. sororia]